MRGRCRRGSPGYPVPARIAGLPHNKTALCSVDWGATQLPTLQSYASAIYQGKWVLLAGRTNGLHGFELRLDAIASPRTIGYVFGGLAANGPHTRGVAGVQSFASNRVFEVVLAPVPEPSSVGLSILTGLSFGLRRRAPQGG